MLHKTLFSYLSSSLCNLPSTVQGLSMVFFTFLATALGSLFFGVICVHCIALPHYSEGSYVSAMELVIRHPCKPSFHSRHTYKRRQRKVSGLVWLEVFKEGEMYTVLPKCISECVGWLEVFKEWEMYTASKL